MQIYSNPDRESDPQSLPDVEVFQLTHTEAAALNEDLVSEYMKKRPYRLALMNRMVREAMLEAIVEDEGIEGGWFWQTCSPGCLPDSDPFGPFKTKAEAIEDAQSQND